MTFPFLCADTSPVSSSTDAISRSLERQMRFLFVALSGVTVAESVIDFPAIIVFFFGETEIA